MKKISSERAGQVKAAISGKLAEIISTSDLTRKELARKIGMDASDITRCLNGGRFNFTIDSLAHIEEVLDIKIFSASLFPDSHEHDNKDCCWTLTVKRTRKTVFHDPSENAPKGHPSHSREIRLKEGESFKINFED